MHILVTGATGFVGHHLVQELASAGHQVSATGISPVLPKNLAGASSYHCCDVTDRAVVRELIQRLSPDGVVHLAAISNVKQSEADLSRLYEVNVHATQLLCEACAAISKPVAFLFVSTGLVYQNHGGQTLYVDENSLPSPGNAYGCSKIAAEQVVRMYRSESFLPYIVRPFNHIGPGQSSDFVVPSFVRKIGAASSGDRVTVGNLESTKDFSDVRDIVKAYRLIIEKRPQEADLFILGSGKAVRIGHLFDEICRLAGKQVIPDVDPTLLRKEQGMVLPNVKLAMQHLGWQPRIDFETSLRDIINYELEL